MLIPGTAHKVSVALEFYPNTFYVKWRNGVFFTDFNLNLGHTNVSHYQFYIYSGNTFFLCMEYFFFILHFTGVAD